ncbi:MAG: CHAT domain-containing tetratricopeptide repeat protein [Blastocatellia bacterium]
MQERFAGSLKETIHKNEVTLEKHRAARDRFNETATLSKLGALYDLLGEKKTAIEYYDQALALSREVKFKRGEAYILNGLAAAYYSIAEKQKALDYYERALPLFKEGFEPKQFNYSFTIEGVYGDLGIPVISYYDAAQLPPVRPPVRPPPIARFEIKPLRDLKGEAVTLNGIGLLHADFSEPERAIEYFEQALKNWRSTNREGGAAKEGEAATLNNIGGAYRVLGNTQKAVEYYTQSLNLRREIGDLAGEAITLNNMGAIYDAANDRANALKLYNDALRVFREQGDRKGQATAINNIATNRWSSGEKQKGLEFYKQALTLSREIGDRAGEANTLYNMAIVARDIDNLDDARSHIEAAIDIIENQRASIRRQELRTSFFASAQDYYELYTDLLMQLHRLDPSAGYDAYALQSVERAHARSLLELLTEAGADIREGVEPSLLERERSLQRSISGKSERQLQLLNGQHTAEQAAVIKKELDDLLAQYQQVEAQIRASSPRYAALMQPRPLSLKEIQQQVLDADTLLLEYSLGKTRSYVWVVSATAISSYELPAGDVVESAARRFYELLIAPNTQVTPQSRGLRVVKAQAQDERLEEANSRLSQMLLGQASQQLGKKRLLIVADGALQYIPFAALLDLKTGAQPLIVDHEILSLPSASTIAVIRQESRRGIRPTKTIAVLADPVFDRSDERIQAGIKMSASEKPTPAQSQPAPERRPGPERRSAPEERPATVRGESNLRIRPLEPRIEKAALAQPALPSLHIQRLPGTKQEAGEILSLVAYDDRFEALSFKASRETATGKELEQFRYLHFATHGFLDSIRPELSGIVLSMVNEKGEPENGFLLAHEIYNLRLPAELVVLSACETGLGKQIRGEGVIGLTRGFMYAGAKRVVVSLWSVDDEATKELMVAFYKGMLKEAMRPTAALRAAQIKMWKQKQWQAPYYWAAFVLQGEYK